MSTRIATMGFEHIPQAMRLKDLAGWNQSEKDWQRLIGMNPGGCFIVLRENTVVGTITTMTYEERVSWVGMVLVDPAERGCGIGTRLLSRALGYLKDKGIRSIYLDATPEGKHLYQKLGFQTKYELERWTLERQPTSQVEASLDAVDLRDVMEFDRQIFGADRSALLISLFDAAPHLTVVQRRGSVIDGYVFGREGAFADHMGPWVARGHATAEKLLDRFLLRSGRAAICADCVNELPSAIPLLRARGFRCSRPLTRMYLGNRISSRRTAMYSILGPEFG